MVVVVVMIKIVNTVKSHDGRHVLAHESGEWKMGMKVVERA